MDTKTRIVIGSAFTLSALFALWPYLIPQTNWFGRTMWDGFVAVESGAFGDEQPWIVYVMTSVPLVALLSGLLVFTMRKMTVYPLDAGTFASTIIFPYGTILGLSVLVILLKNRKSKGSENQSSHITSASAPR